MTDKHPDDCVYRPATIDVPNTGFERDPHATEDNKLDHSKPDIQVGHEAHCAVGNGEGITPLTPCRAVFA
jgi:hypothetical protein